MPIILSEPLRGWVDDPPLRPIASIDLHPTRSVRPAGYVSSVSYWKDWYRANLSAQQAYGRKKYRKRMRCLKKTGEYVRYRKRILAARKKRRREDSDYREREIRGNHKQKLKHYKLTIEMYDAMVEVQKSLCAICKQPERSKRLGRVKRLAVDHCHRTGKVRGLLCSRCNRGIGLFEDDPKHFIAAANYLKLENL